MLDHLPWALIIGTAALLIAQAFTILAAFKHLLDHDELPPLLMGAAPFISVIIPARNEEKTLPLLLADLAAQDYPRGRFEVVVVDDGSEDATLAVAQGCATSGVSVLRSVEMTGKKAAIELGVDHAMGDLVLVTDADARCGPLRLQAIARAWQRAPFDMLLMPIAVHAEEPLLQDLQASEQAGFMAVAIASARAGSPLIANGANMAFRRSVFQALSGYDGNRHVPSGDDMFLLRKMRWANKTVTCLATPEVVVRVLALPTWRAFLDQRLRWVGKMKAPTFGLMGLLPFIALLIPVLLWMNTLLCTASPLFTMILWCAWLIPLVALTTSVHGTIERRASPFTVALHLVVFSVYAPLIALLSLIHQPQWKGRSTPDTRGSGVGKSSE